MQSENALEPIFVILSVIFIDTKLEQPENALFPIFVILSGIDIFGKIEQPENAWSLIDKTSCKIVILVILFGVKPRPETVLFIASWDSDIAFIL